MKVSKQMLARLTPEEKRALLKKMMAETERSPASCRAPLSLAQNGLWVASRLDPLRIADNLLNAYRLDGPLEPQVLARCFSEIVARHETLRTTFDPEDEDGCQVIAPPFAVALPITHLGHLPEKERDTRAHHLAIAATAVPFDLAKGPLFRPSLLKTGDEAHILLLVMHHIVGDNWSYKVINDELSVLYPAFLAGRESPLPPLPCQFRDHVAAERKSWTGTALQRELGFWTQALAGLTPVELPVDRPRPPRETHRGSTLSRGLPAVIGRQLKALASQTGASVTMAFLAGFQTLLYRYSGLSRVSCGMPSANRESLEAQQMIGFFVNTLIMDNDLSGNPPFAEVVGRVRDFALEAYEHPHAPFDMLVAALGLRREPGRNPLAPIVFQSGMLPELALAGLRVSKVFEADYGIVRNDLECYLTEDGGRLKLVLVFNRDLYDRAGMERLANHFETLLAAAAAAPDTRIDDLPVLTPEERNLILDHWNATDEPRRGPQVLSHLFRQQVGMTPDGIATETETEHDTYAALDERAGRLACFLRERGVSADVPVGICLHRGLNLARALMATLKAGGAYLPLDPTYPADRLAYMIEDAAVPVILCELATVASLPAGDCEIILVDELAEEIDGRQPFHAPTLPDHAAYIIYTSGSSGRPKGVVVPHRGICNTLVWRQATYPLQPGDRILQTTSFSFDASVWELFAPLISGATLVLSLPPGAEGRVQIPRLIRRHGVKAIQLPPSWLNLFLEEPDLKSLHSLTSIITGAEPVSRELQEKIFARTGCRFENLYGPTEASLDVTAWSCDPEDSRPFAPIGKPIDNTRVFLVDDLLRPALPGRAGELVIAGLGLARGYLGRPSLTAEKFVPDPFAKNPGERLYRTGDLAKWLNTGVLQFLGRLDNQVKIRGFRIELEEITATINAQEGVAEAAVVVQEDQSGSKRLVAYVVARETAGERLGNLHDALARVLPDYMVPAAFVMLAGLPLSPNGKLDQSRLPAPDYAGDTKDYAPPRNDLESKLAALWAQALNLKQVGIHDNFFRIGGDSILAIQVVTVAKRAGISLSPKHIFQAQTIAALTAHVRNEEQVVEQPVSGEVPLSPIQHWFLEKNFSRPAWFNQSFLLELKRPLNEACLDCAFTALCLHHDSLRLRFSEGENTWRQRYATFAEPSHFFLERSDLSGVRDRDAAMAAAIEAAQGRLDLANGPLAGLLLFDCGRDRSQRLLITIHHLAVDGVSWRILLEDLERALDFFHHNPHATEMDLGAKTTSFQTWVTHLQQAAVADSFCAEQAYWQNLEIVASVPRDGSGGENRTAGETSISMALTREETSALLQRAPGTYNTRVNDLLLTAMILAVANLTGQRRLSLDLEGHGREDLFEGVDLGRTVGWFTTSFPVTLSLADLDPEAAIMAVKEQLRQIPHAGIGYGLLRYLNPAIGPHLAERPRPALIFNYLGQFDQSFDHSRWFGFDENSARGSVSPKDHRFHELDVYAMVSNGRLRINWRYHPGLHTAETVRALAETYLAQLRQLIEVCLVAEPRMTPSDFPLARLEQGQLDRWRELFGGFQDVYPLTPMQQGMIFHSLYQPETLRYTQQIGCGLRGTLAVDTYREAWQRVADRHPVMRSLFMVESGEPLQLVLAQKALDWVFLDWRGQSNLDRKLHTLLEAERSEGFDYARESPQRFRLVQTAEDKFYFVWTHHHSLLDGWSLPILLQEVTAIYAALVKGLDAPRLVPVPPYRDYVAFVRAQDRPAATKYWRSVLGGFETPNQLPAPQARTEKNKDHDNLDLLLPGEDYQALQTFTREIGITFSTLMQGAWALFLAHYCTSEDIVFGVTASGRPPELEGSERMVGLFINTLPLRIRIDVRKNLAAWLQEIQATHARSLSFELTPLNESQAQADTARGVALFETILVFENYPLAETMQTTWTGLAVEDVYFTEKVEYPLVLQVMPGEGLILKFKYDPRRFTLATIAAMQEHLHHLLQEMTNPANSTLIQLNCLTESQREQVLHRWNDTRAPYAHDRCMHQLFEAQVLRTPSAPALIAGDLRLSYAQLNARCNRLAHFLIGRGVKPGVLVGVCLRRNEDLVIATMAVLKAGGAYVPMDFSFPLERIAFILEDCDSLMLLTHGAIAGELGELPRQTVCLDRTSLADFSSQNPASGVSADDLAYIIFTSGSTGRPKGVILQHRPVINLIEWVNETYRVGAGDRLLFITSLCFDLSVYDIFGILACGAEIYVASDAQLKDPESLALILDREGITFWDSAPAALYQLHPFLPPEAEGSPALRLVFNSGDWIPLSLPPLLKKVFPNLHFVALGGATEATIWSNYFDVDYLDPAWVSVPYGYPIQNAAYYVLDPYLRPTAPGVPGDLYIGDRCLSWGYFNRPDLTAERYLPNPYARDAGGVLYATGDRARWFSDGKLEFLGRLDQQVKIRGYRIELGEIEAVLAEDPQVREAVVLAREDQPGDKRLVAYVQPADPSSVLDLMALRRTLQQNLPDYMVPVAIVGIAAWPVTANGKLNRKALPVPEFSADEASFVAPESEKERLLAAIWSQVLHVPRIGVSDNYFELGGDSILAIQIVGRVRQAGYHFSLPDLFRSPSLGEMAAGLTTRITEEPAVTREKPHTRFPLANLTREQEADLARRYGAIADVYPTLPIQEGMLFHGQLYPDSLAYHEQLSFTIKADVDLDLLQRTWQILVDRHPIMRTLFIAGEEQPLQVVLAQHPLAWRLVSWPELSLEAQQRRWEDHLANDLRAGFQFSEKPPLRVTVWRDSLGGIHFAMSFHHVLMDGWSFWILLRELAVIYRALLQDEVPQLPPASGFGAYVAWMQNRDMTAAETFWRRHLRGFRQPTELRDALMAGDGTISHEAVQKGLGVEETGQLHRFIRAHGLTMTALVQGAWALLLAQYSDREDILFGVTVSGRSPELDGVETIVGPFLGTIPFRVRVPREGSLVAWLRTTQQLQTESRTFEYAPLVAIRKWSDLPASGPLFEIIFTFYNDPFYQSLKGVESALEMENIRFIDENNFHLDLSARVTPKFEAQVKFNRHRYPATLAENLMDDLLDFLVRLGTEDQDLGTVFTRFAETEHARKAASLESFKQARAKLRPKRRPAGGSE